MKTNKFLNILRIATLFVAVICILIAMLSGGFDEYWIIGWTSMILSSIINFSMHRLRNKK
ncbi:hypothetical protein [Clostridium paridis]|uniref:Uncharacterized protein n=1 Tax=Clostridium paridis TaxID=2803863 RepID=A0A937FHV4_9CLOT|nr:hypothetical protein [Clostridium paridis]MBL4931701.1 hypothetical protein [Clostridium paridis]